MKFGGYRSGMKCEEDNDDDELLIWKTWVVQGIAHFPEFT
jgi:hypothetical protein